MKIYSTNMYDGLEDPIRSDSMWKDIAKFGKKLADNGLVNSRFGNISIRLGNKMLITKTCAVLSRLTEDSVVEIDIDKYSNLDMVASSETIVHRAIYKNTDARSIIHAHPPFSVIASLRSNNVAINKYSEIPVIKGNIGTEELADNASVALCGHKGVIIFNHGTITIGEILDEAYNTTVEIEAICKSNI